MYDRAPCPIHQSADPRAGCNVEKHTGLISFGVERLQIQMTAGDRDAGLRAALHIHVVDQTEHAAAEIKRRLDRIEVDRRCHPLSGAATSPMMAPTNI